jgi:hypothetical protein
MHLEHRNLVLPEPVHLLLPVLDVPPLFCGQGFRTRPSGRPGGTSCPPKAGGPTGVGGPRWCRAADRTASLAAAQGPRPAGCGRDSTDRTLSTSPPPLPQITGAKVRVTASGPKEFVAISWCTASRSLASDGAAVEVPAVFTSAVARRGSRACAAGRAGTSRSRGPTSRGRRIPRPVPDGEGGFRQPAVRPAGPPAGPRDVAIRGGPCPT